jgi:hypothetical protein
MALTLGRSDQFLTGTVARKPEEGPFPLCWQVTKLQNLLSLQPLGEQKGGSKSFPGNHSENGGNERTNLTLPSQIAPFRIVLVLQ